MYQPYYPPPQQPYQYPPPTVPTTTATTTTTTTKTKTTTTKKPKRRRKKKKPTPKPKHQSGDRYITRLSEDQVTSLSQPQLTIKNNKVVPVLNPQQQAILTKRFGLPAVQARRFNNPSYKIRGRRRLPPYKMGMAQSYDHKRPPGADRRFDMPNIFSQSGFQVILASHCLYS